MMSTASHPARGTQLMSAALTVERRDDGVLVLKHPDPLALSGTLVPQMFRQQAANSPDAIFIKENVGAAQETSTYAEFLNRCDGVARGLVEKGAKPGHIIVVAAENGISYAVLMMAALSIGVIVAPLPPQSLAVAPSYVAAVCQMLGAFAFSTDDPAAAEIIDLPYRISLNGGQDGWHSLDELVGPADVKITPLLDSLTPDMIAKIMFTSGSTGGPKPVINTHGMLSAAQDIQAQLFTHIRDMGDTERYTLTDWLPWHHTYGGNSNFNSVIWSGGQLVIDRGKPTPTDFHHTLSVLKDDLPSLFIGVPISFSMLVDALEGDDDLAKRFFGEVRGIVNGGAALGEAVITRLQALAAKWRGEPIFIGGGYGMTETSAIITQIYWAGAHPETLGLPPPGVEVKLVPLGDGRYECAVRGPNVTPGYYSPDGPVTEGLFDDEGFLRTGDALCLINEADPKEGLRYAGRLKEEFKLANGVWVRVGQVRTDLINELSDYVHDVVIVGENKDEVGALLWMKDNSNLSTITERLDRFNALHKGASRRIARVAMLAAPPNAAAGEIVAKGGLNQIRMRQTRSAEIDALYACHFVGTAPLGAQI